MFANRSRRTGHRVQLLVACAAITVVGLTLMGIALASQHHAPQPPAATAHATLPAASNSPTTTAIPSVQSSGSASGVSPAPAPSAAGLPRSQPTSIVIPALGVHASFVQLGLNSDGTIQVPDDVTHVGWYKLGPSPGQVGPAIVLGHVDSAKNGAGVFYKLGAAKNGDTIEVSLADGRVATFVVYAVREYAKDAFPTSTVYGNTAGSELRLITCGGRFDKSSGHYLSNIVVFARAR